MVARPTRLLWRLNESYVVPTKRIQTTRKPTVELNKKKRGWGSRNFVSDTLKTTVVTALTFDSQRSGTECFVFETR